MRYFLPKEILKAIEAIGFSVQQNVDYIFLRIFSPAGQDYNLIFDKDECRDFDAFADEIYDRYEDFDVSSEAMLWLDSEGHGKNGAPYEMKAVLEDMEWLENKLFELYRAVKGVIAILHVLFAELNLNMNTLQAHMELKKNINSARLAIIHIILSMVITAK